MKTAKEIKSAFPKRFKVTISKTGLTVRVYHKLNGDWDSANDIVYKVAKKLGLDEVGAGTNCVTGVRDWEFIAKDVESAMHKEACSILKAMKAFFKKWAKTYCSSSKTYDVIEQMRTLVQSDEA